jgi:hypothetical protein
VAVACPVRRRTERSLQLRHRAEETASNDVLFFVLLVTAAVLTVAFAATPFYPGAIRLGTVLLGAAALGMVLFVGYPTPWLSLLVITAV